MSGRRAFANKLLKDSNERIRQKITKSLPKFNSRPNSSFSEVPFNEVIEPIDIEEFLESPFEDPIKTIIDFPSDDIEVNVCQRVISTVKPVKPDDSDNSQQNINLCLQCYTSNWVVVNKKYEKCVHFNQRSDERVSQIKTIQRQEYEVDFEVNKSCEDKSIKTNNYWRFVSEDNPPENPSTPSSNRQSLLSDSSTLTPGGSDLSHSRNVSISSWNYIDFHLSKEQSNSLSSNYSRSSRTSSIFNLQNSQSDPLIAGLLDDISCDQLDLINEQRRQEGRHPTLFTLYPFPEEEDLIELRPQISAPSEPNRHKIIVKCVSLKLELEIEPIFASLALYDAKEKKKLSENFYFDMNCESLKKLLSNHIPYEDASTLSSSCIFNITFPSNDLFLVLKLEKVLQGDVNECTEPYVNREDKNREKLRSNAVQYCERLGKYRMPFAWTAIYLTDVITGNPSNCDNNGIFSEESKGSSNSLDSIKKRDSGSLNRKGSLERQKTDKCLTNEEISDSMNSFKSVTLTISSFFKQDNDKLTDEDLYKYLLDLKRPNSTLKRLKCIPGALKLDISPFPLKYPKYCLTPELAQIDPYPDERGKPIRELLEFPAKEVFSSHFVYRNLLYIYPKSVNFTNRQGSARNIAIKIQIMNNEEECLSIIFGKSSCPELSSEAFTSVSYHNKCPNFNDEIKVKLISKLTEKTHILFTFFHIHTKPKQSEQTTNDVLGYTWIPLYRKGRLQTGSFCLPVMIDKPPNNYCLLMPSNQIPNTRWVDNHKGVFNVVVEAVSSIYSQDPYIDNFLHMWTVINRDNSPQRTNVENEFKTSIVSLSSAQIEPLVKFLPIVLNRLIGLLVCQPIINGSKVSNISQSVFKAIVGVVSKINGLYSENSESRLLSTFIQFQVLFPDQTLNEHIHSRSRSEIPISFSNESKPVINRTNSYSESKKSDHQKIFHEELVKQWLVCSGSYRDIALSNTAFFLEIIVKSIYQHLSVSGSLNIVRRQRFSKQFLDHILSLIDLITSEIINRLNREIKDNKVINCLNHSMAFFIRDLLSALDRNYVFNLIRSYFKQMSNTSNFSSETSINQSFLVRLDFLRIISGHEHFICLNLPFGTPTTTLEDSSERMTPFSELTDDYRRQHFLTGIIFCSLSLALEMNSASIHSKAINLIRGLLTSHDWDCRYSDPLIKSRIASLYLPLISIVLDSLYQLFDPKSKEVYSKTPSVCNTLKSEDLSASPLNQTVAMAIAGTGIFNLNEEQGYQPRRWPLREDTSRHLLICFIWVLKNVNQTVLNRYFNEMSFKKIYQLIEVLKICISSFEYKGLKEKTVTFHKTLDLRSKLEEMGRKEILRKTQSSQNFSKSDSVRWNRRVDCESEAILDAILSTELNFVALDAIERVKRIQNLSPNIMQIVLHSLSLNQSTNVLQNIFSTQRSLNLRFPQIIFDHRFEFCAELCLQLLRHCSSSVGLIRAQSAASLYLLMRQNYSQNFAKIKMQITMSLSHLVGTSKSFNEPNLRRSLKTILDYAVIDSEVQESSFPEQVQELVFNLHMILSDTIKMKEYKDDPEMLLDLMYRIAKGYQNSPDLRLTWLQSMAQKHSDRANNAEAAHCLIHSCALIAEYLRLSQNKTYLPNSCLAFEKISSNISEESLVSNAVPIDEKNGICATKSFSESGLVALLEQSALYFNASQMYEAISEVYKLVIPLAEVHNDYKKLASIYGKLQNAYIKIDERNGKRVFGTYFRVVFYGSKFGDLDGEEFVYKEPFATKLPEISQRLENFYSQQFGSELVQMIKDSNPVDVNKLDPNKAYIQITFVEPYFDSWELHSRQTYFQKNYNIKRFIYTTPFTMDGKAHGDLHQQYQRKTILTTVNSFPYVKTRILVEDRQQIVLTPIEVAIEDIQKKTTELGNAINQEPVDPKLLQMVLQGCVGTTVNQGPFQVASVFLSESDCRTPDERPASPLRDKLKSCFEDFCRKCGDALRKNRTLIGLDQKEYQKELERNYYKFTEKLAPLISTNGQALRALRELDFDKRESHC